MIPMAGEESNERQGLQTKELYFTQKDHLHLRLCKEEHQAKFTKSNEKESEVFKTQMTALNHGRNNGEWRSNIDHIRPE